MQRLISRRQHADEETNNNKKEPDGDGVVCAKICPLFIIEVHSKKWLGRYCFTSGDNVTSSITAFKRIDKSITSLT